VDLDGAGHPSRTRWRRPEGGWHSGWRSAWVDREGGQAGGVWAVPLENPSGRTDPGAPGPPWTEVDP